MKAEYKRNIKVGMFVSIGILILIAAVILVGNINDTFSSKMKIVSVFGDVKGLKEGDNVWFSGVKIGTVYTLEFLENSQVKITMNIDKETRKIIHKDANIKLGTNGLIGNKILIIYGGTSASELLEEGDMLASVKTISSEEVMNMLQKNNMNILEITTQIKELTQSINAGTGTLGKLVTSDDLYNSFSSLSNNLAKIALKANSVLDDLNEFSNNLNQEGSLANTLVNDTTLTYSLQQSFVRLAQITDSTKLMISEINRITQNKNSTAGLLLNDEETAAQFKRTLENLQSGSEKLDEDLEALQHSFILRRYFKKKANQTRADE